MARMPRKYVVDEDETGVYHRRQFIQDRLEFLAGVFGIDVLAFAVMSNHLHVVLRNRPDVVRSWSDDEVAHALRGRAGRPDG